MSNDIYARSWSDEKSVYRAYKSLSILTDVVTGVMLALEAEMQMPFVYIGVVKIHKLNLWKMFRKDEKIFMRVLTQAKFYGMIAME